jgi:UDP-3-O-[3-hydroxymyristoyl] glucosamine N-acyltransferase
VGGTNGKTGALYARPKAADIGSRAIIKANMYAPNGTLSIGSKAEVEGSFIAKDVEIGSKASVRHNSANWPKIFYKKLESTLKI